MAIPEKKISCEGKGCGTVTEKVEVGDLLLIISSTSFFALFY